MSSRYIPALDGLRALAVIAVVIYHMNATVLQSGLLGVTIFFVSSGYLITGLLIREWSTARKINLPQFWLRRVRGCSPAIVFVLAGTIVLTAAFAPDMLTKLRNDLPPPFSSSPTGGTSSKTSATSRPWGALSVTSLLVACHRGTVLPHLASASPPAVLEAREEAPYPAGTSDRRRRVRRGDGAVLHTQADPSRVYYGTDTRVFSLLIGAFLAFEFPPARINGTGNAASPHETAGSR